MTTDKLYAEFNNNAGIWDKCLAYHDWRQDTLYVFTDISHKRYNNTCWGNGKFTKNKKDKIIFVTNKQLIDFSMFYADLWFIQEARKLAFDGKLGTEYMAKDDFSTTFSSYFGCLRSKTVYIKPKAVYIKSFKK